MGLLADRLQYAAKLTAAVLSISRRTSQCRENFSLSEHLNGERNGAYRSHSEQRQPAARRWSSFSLPASSRPIPAPSTARGCRPAGPSQETLLGALAC